MKSKNLLFRYLRFFLCGLLAFLLVEGGAMFYVNNYYLTDRSEYTVKRVTGASSSSKFVDNISVESGAKRLAVSPGGKYLAYLVDNTVKILDLSTAAVYTVPPENGMQVAMYKWVYNRDRLIIAETAEGTGDYYAKTYYYDMKDRELTEIRDNHSDESIKIELSSDKDTITQMDFSTETVVTYLKVTNEKLRNKVWEINVMVGDNVDRLTGLMTNNIGKIQCLKSVDELIYEDEDNGKVYKNGSTKAISVEGSTSLKIIGFDSNDNIYFGKVTGGQVTALYYGSLIDENWQEITLDKPCDSSMLSVTYAGTVLENEASDHTLVNLSTEKRVPYQGDFIGVYDKGFVTNNGSVILNYTF